MSPSLRVRSFGFVVVVLGFVVAAAPRAVAPRQLKDIVDTAIAAGSFKTLVAAVQAADLVAQLKGAGPYTVNVQIRRPGAPEAIHAQFEYTHP